MFLVDKYRPSCIEEMIYHHDIIDKFRNLIQNNEFPNIIINGKCDSTTELLAKMLLEMLYDKSVHKTTEINYNITSSKTISEIPIKQSNFHIVIERNNNNNSDKYIVQDIIKEYAKRHPMNTFLKTKRSFKTVLIMDTDTLSHPAQASLRRTTEMYAKTCRFIMISSSLSKIIEPLRSRCLCIRVPGPNKEQIFETITHVMINENLKLSLREINHIINTSDMNIKTCLWKLDKIRTKNNTKLDLHITIDEISDLLLEYKIQNIEKLRGLIYKLLTTTINNSDVIKLITNNLIYRISDEHTKYLIINTACKYDHLLKTSRRDIKQLEPFVIDIFCVIHEPSLL
jgi:replication factor C subunit 3/5